MSGYIWMLLWLLIYTALSAVLEVQQSETVCGVQTVRFTKLWAALGVLPLLIFCTLRGDIGDDLQNLIPMRLDPRKVLPLPLGIVLVVLIVLRVNHRLRRLAEDAAGLLLPRSQFRISSPLTPKNSPKTSRFSFHFFRRNRSPWVISQSPRA